MKWILLAAVAIATSAMAAPDDEAALGLMAQARLKGCAGHGGAGAALRWSDAVARAAARVGRGEAPLSALEAEGHRARHIFQARFTGVAGPRELARAFVSNYCAALSDPRFAEAGVHREGTRWIVLLAAPLEVPELADRRAALSRVLALTNAARSRPRRCGDKAFDAAPPVRWSPQLERAAARHAQDMASHAYLEHRGRDGSTPAQRVSQAGYKWRGMGENVASGQLTPQQVVDDWLDSPGHCANLMSPEFTEMGVSYGINMGAKAVVFWAQEFGRPR